jgi:riboflavin kinase/FMN adenylyltransferase
VELIRGLYNIRSRHAGCVATIGNFDGLHLGHQKLLQNLIVEARQLNLPSLVITFEPLPGEYFLKQQAPARLLRLREKLKLLQDCAIDRVLCLRFNQALANLSAEQFVADILVKQLAVKQIIIGDDFHFGKNRQGNFALLQKLGRQYGFQVTALAAATLNGERIGSSRVRAALLQGDLKFAARLLGRPYGISGHVIYGKQLGRQLGFPTINIPLPHQVLPMQGIFAVKVHGLDRQPLFGAASMGNRPAVDGTKNLLEVYLFDFNAVAYGRFVSVEFIEKIRDERYFASLETLKAQIAQDVARVREIVEKL